MSYNQLSNEELICLLELKDKKINELEKQLANGSNVEDVDKKDNNISFKIIGFRDADGWIRIELLWTNNTSENIRYVDGTIKFLDKDGNVLSVDSHTIGRSINAYSESAFVVEYLIEDGVVPSDTASVTVAANEYYR